MNQKVPICTGECRWALMCIRADAFAAGDNGGMPPVSAAVESMPAAYARMEQEDLMEITIKDLTALPRLEDGRFDLSSMGNDCYETARYVYPMYAAYETDCNKKEGYPDLMAQLWAMAEELKEDDTFAHAADFLDLLIHTIDHISVELYEYYRELVDMFRENVREVIRCYGTQDGGFEAPDAQMETVTIDGRRVTREQLAKDAIRHACEGDVLLTEKYQVYF